ncbi:MAG: hypothetical protein AUH84_07350 [Thaumarchaeota archaeon 13_1_40CM_4_38_7]|nr:MAG: hypothetical protein AUH84_07350 [Thaumarchaeota archaeon 13_1_40CM_4_38_7]OLC93255.1 MAG: hypothetical protein AUI92_03295 [Thaumarchaeota archaeon 13_1_40CM_3_38_6]
MSKEHDIDTEKQNTKDEKNHFEIFVGDIKEEWSQSQVLASDIIKKAGTEDVTTVILEALDHRNGKAVAEFKPNEMVDLTLRDRKFFRITPGGGGFS